MRAAAHIEMRSFRWIGWSGFALFALSTVGALLAGQYWAAFGLATFGAIGAYVALGAGSFTLDEQSVSHRSSFGQWRIRWSEVVSAEASPSGTLVLVGIGKRFVLPPRSWWSTPDIAAALALVERQLKTHGVAVRPSRTADYRTMKNTKVASRDA